jgi:3-hydroxybutyrate dehydrogenase
MQCFLVMPDMHLCIYKVLLGMKKTILVTGSTGVIGLSISQFFYKKGFNVIINGKCKPSQLRDVKKIFNNKRALFFNCDLTKTTNVRKIVKSSISKFKKIDVLVNCAGIQFVESIEKYPEKVWRKMIDINLTTPFLFIKEVLPLMKKNKWGRIINIASTHGLIGSKKKSAYTASKHGLVGLTKVVALETAEENITCNSICPGFVLTELIQDQIETISKNKNINIKDAEIELLKEKQPSLSFVNKQNIAALIFYLSTENASQITGANLSIDGGWTAQ